MMVTVLARDARDDSASGVYEVVWWYPASLELDRAPNFGLRREELIAKDAPPAVIAEGQGRYYTWRANREGALERGATPSQRIVTVRARAADGRRRRGRGCGATNITSRRSRSSTMGTGRRRSRRSRFRPST